MRELSAQEAAIPAPVEPQPIETGWFEFQDDKGHERQIAARVVITAQDGGLLLLARDGVLWPVGPEQLQTRRELETPWKPLTVADYAADVPLPLGPQFRTHQTEHYALVTNTTPAYAQWCGTLFERLWSGFYTFWEQRGWQLTPPEFPLPVVIFANQADYAKFAQQDVGEEVTEVPGYYSIATNRSTLFDLTAEVRGQPARSPAEVQTRVEAGRYNVATIVHEATHQIAFNSGMHVRLADNPLWLTEGMAMFFETPDLRNKTGWRTAGIVNRPRLDLFRAGLSRRPADSLRQLIRSDARLSSAETAAEAYAESWGLTYYLIKNQPEQYVDYLQALSKQQPLVPVTAEERLGLFEKHFGDAAEVDQQCLKSLRSLSR